MSLINKYDVSQRLNIPVRTVEDMVYKRKIPYVKVGRSVKFSEADVKRFINSKTIKNSIS